MKSKDDPVKLRHLAEKNFEWRRKKEEEKIKMVFYDELLMESKNKLSTIKNTKSRFVHWFYELYETIRIKYFGKLIVKKRYMIN